MIENPTIENISAQMGQQHKVRNFYNNIVDPMYAQNNPSIGDITADTHAVAADLMKPLGGSALEVTHNFGGAGSASSALSGAQGTTACTPTHIEKPQRKQASCPGDAVHHLGSRPGLVPCVFQNKRQRRRYRRGLEPV